MNITESIVITGLSVISPFGENLDTCTEHISEQHKYGIEYQKSEFGEVPVGTIPNGFIGKTMTQMDRRFFNRITITVCDAVEECIDKAGLKDQKELLNATGIISGSAFGCVTPIERMFKVLRDKGPNFVDPVEFPWTSHNFPISAASIRNGMKGPITALVNSMSSDLNALIYSAIQIQKKQVERMIVVAFDEINWPLYSFLNAKGYMNCSMVRDNKQVPVSVIEGCAVMMLESEASARRRKAPIWGKLGKLSISSKNSRSLTPSAIAGSIKSVLGDQSALVVCRGSGHSAEYSIEKQAIDELNSKQTQVADYICLKPHIGNSLGAASLIEAALLLNLDRQGKDFTKNITGYYKGNHNMVSTGREKTYVFNQYGLESNIISVAIASLHQLN